MPGGRIWYGAGRPIAQCLNCLSGDTLVWTDQGIFPSSELDGKIVNVLNRNGKYSPAKWSCFGTQRLYKITLSNGDIIEATINHEWVVSKAKGGYEKVTTQNLMGRNIPVQSCPFMDINEEEYRAGIRHGLIYGDGSLYHDGRYSYLQQFGDSKPLVEKYFDDPREWKSTGATVAVRQPAEYCFLPSTNRSKSYLLGFLAGFIAADGHCDSRGHVMLHQNNKEVLGKVRLFAAILGIPTSSIKLTRKLNPWTGEEAPLYKLTFIKEGVTEKLLLKESHLKNFKSSSPAGKKYTQQVVSIEDTGRDEPVYCCHEPETNTFVIGAGYVTGNCFVIPTEDSREGWAKSVGDNIIIAGTGGGNGQNYSNIRFRGAPIRGTGGFATGAVSLMKIENAVLEEVRGGASRRAARMMCLNIDHPDIEEFLSVKLDLKQLNNANISVVFMTDPEEFFDLVKNDLPLELKWQGQVIKTINAKELWQKIVSNALKNGEPGILNGFLANHLSNIYYCRTLVSTNPCGEIFMQPYSTCCLGALVLPNFVRTKSKAKDIRDRIDWDALRHSVTTAVRFLDDVLDVTHYPTDDLKKESKATRRIGLGIMGLHYFLLLLGLKYSSEEGRELVGKVMDFIKSAAYDASISLAIEKGPFPEFDAEKFCNSAFVKSLKPALQYKIKTYGIRNCAILTIAPTGTTSMVMEVSSGIEPIFAMAYERRWRDDQAHSSTIKKEVVIDPLYKRFLLEGLDTSHFESASDIHPEDHLRMQVICQKHIDNAVSKTINLPKDMYTEETLSELYMNYLPLVKGLTIYPEGSRGESPLTRIEEEEARQLVLANATTSEISDDCASGTCSI